jgi:hypothetical protein
MRALTCTIDVAGRISAKNSPCARPTSSQRATVGDVHARAHDVLQPRAGLL